MADSNSLSAMHPSIRDQMIREVPELDWIANTHPEILAMIHWLDTKTGSTRSDDYVLVNRLIMDTLHKVAVIDDLYVNIAWENFVDHMWEDADLYTRAENAFRFMAYRPFQITFRGTAVVPSNVRNMSMRIAVMTAEEERSGYTAISLRADGEPFSPHHSFRRTP